MESIKIFVCFLTFLDKYVYHRLGSAASVSVIMDCLFIRCGKTEILLTHDIHRMAEGKS
jgi:hypothetical protein